MPINQNAIFLELTSAVTALTNQLMKQNKFIDDREKKTKEQPGGDFRATSDAAMDIVARVRPKLWTPRSAEDSSMPPSPRRQYGEERGVHPGEWLPPDERTSGLPPDTRQQLTQKQLYNQLRTEKKQSAYKALRAYAPNASGLAPNVDVIEDALGPSGQGINDPIVPWMMMGEGAHGAPRVVRNLAMSNWQLQQSAKWTGKVAGALGDQLGEGSVLQGPLQTVQGAAGWAQANPGKALAGSMAVAAGFRTIGKISESVSNWRDIGEILGYKSGDKRAFVGHQLSGATQAMIGGGLTAAEREGLSYSMERRRLMGQYPGGGPGSIGFGLSGKQATDIMDTLANQGWNNDVTKNSALSAQGNATTIAQHFMGPMQRAYAGLNGKDLGQFTEQLRYGASGIDDLRLSLGNLRDTATETNRTIGQVTGSIHDYMEATAAQGGNTMRGAATASQWINATGMMPDELAKAIQSPLVQGMAFAKGGVMPWALGQSGTQAGAATLDTVRMLAGATTGMGADTRDKWGAVHSGTANQAGFIAKETGMSYNAVLSMMRHPKQYEARMKVNDFMSDQTTKDSYVNKLAGMGAVDWDKDGNMTVKKGTRFNAQQTANLNQQWTGQLDPLLKQAGASAANIKKWDKEDPVKRMRDAQKFLGQKSGDEANTASVKVHIELSDAAKRVFKQPKGPSQAKVHFGASQPWNGYSSYATVVNTAAGDTSKPGVLPGPTTGLGMPNDAEFQQTASNPNAIPAAGWQWQPQERVATGPGS